ncbi:MAG: mechanosensitive ion channel family protein [Bacteriovoracia bacterium]
MTEILNFLNSFGETPNLVKKVAAHAIHLALLLGVVLVFNKLIKIISKKILDHKAKVEDSSQRTEHEKRVATYVRLIETTLRVVFFGAAIMMALREMGLDITPLLTGAGIAGVAVGFGAQNLVRDVISGFFLLVEDQVRIGDSVQVAGVSGIVERMDLRVTAVRDFDGTLHVLPNGEIKVVSNMTYGFAQAVVKVFVPFKVNYRDLTDVLTVVLTDLENDPEWSAHLRGKPELLGISDFSPNHLKLDIVARTKPHSRWAVAREIRRRVKIAFEKANIESIG